MEEKFRTQVARLGAPGGVDALLQESLDAQVQLKAAKEEMGQREELLGASSWRWSELAHPPLTPCPRPVSPSSRAGHHRRAPPRPGCRPCDRLHRGG